MKYLSVTQAAIYLDVHPKHVKKMIKEGKFSDIKRRVVKFEYLISKEDIEKRIEIKNQKIQNKK